MTAANLQHSRRFVLLLSAGGNPLTTFETDRDVFPQFATFERDRLFRCAYKGEFGPTDGLAVKASGAVYIEVDDYWRISTKSIDKPKPPRRARRSAVILPFVRRNGGAE